MLQQPDKFQVYVAFAADDLQVIVRVSGPDGSGVRQKLQN